MNPAYWDRYWDRISLPREHRRTPGAHYVNAILDVFGRPLRTSGCWAFGVT